MRTRRVWRNSAARHELAQRRLNLNGLPRASQRLLVGAGLVGISLAVLLLINVTRADQSPDLSATHEFLTHDWPAALVLGLLAGFVMTQVLVMRLAGASTRTRRVVLAVISGLLGVLPAAAALMNLHSIGGSYRSDSSTVYWVGAFALALGICATVAGVALAVQRGRTGWANLIVLPLLLYVVGWLVLRIAGSRFADRNDNRFPESLPIATAAASGIVNIGLIVAGLGMAVTLWQAIEVARGTRDTVAAGGVFFSRWIRTRRNRTQPWVFLGILLAVKLVWIVLGLTGILPRPAGGDLDVWADIRSDGWVSWLLAAVLAALIVSWLARGCPGPRDGAGLVPAMALVVGGLTLAEIAYQGLTLSVQFGLGDWAMAAARNVGVAQPWVTVLVIVVACIAAFTRWSAGNRGAGTLFLAAFGLWGVVRLPAMAWELARYPWFPWGLSIPSESMYGPHAGWVSLATIDLAVTVLLLGAALAALSGRPRFRLVPALLVAMTTTIVAYPAGLIDLVLLSDLGNGIAFVLPLAYLFLFDAAALNKAGAARESRLLHVFALTSLALTIGVLRAYFGDPVASQDVNLAASLLIVPALVTSVGMMLARRPAAASAAGLGADSHA